MDATATAGRAVEWRDLVTLTPVEKLWELTLSLPWLAGALVFYERGWWWLGLPCSFYFFLTGLRQSHNAQHYALGLPRAAQDGVLFTLSALMLASMHAVQTTHLHHHRHCLEAEDAEGATARLRWWQAVAAGPLFALRLHRAAWRQAGARQRRWIAAELTVVLVLLAALLLLPEWLALRWHFSAMLAGECFTGFFAVWTVHHDCEAGGSRTQRGRWVNWLSYGMFFHLEHHAFPAVPTAHLPELARRLDQAQPGSCRRQVLAASF